MMGPITARQFHLSSGVGDWRVADEMAPVVVDAGRSRGQRVDVATWIGTDGRGYP
jgi:hypothetical protein